MGGVRRLPASLLWVTMSADWPTWILNMAHRGSFWAPLALLSCLVLRVVCAGRQMPKLSDKKLCADAECSHPILIARALEDYYPQDCRFIPIRQGQVVYVYAMLKGRGNLFWAGSAQGSYYGEQEARLGHFPSSVVQETHALMPATVEVQTDKWDFYCF